MSKRVTINVTQQNIDDAMDVNDEKHAGRRWVCPIDLALVDAGFRGWHTSSTFLYRYEGPEHIASMSNDRVYLPAEAIEFVDYYDTHREVKPLSFEVEMP